MYLLPFFIPKRRKDDDWLLDLFDMFPFSHFFSLIITTAKVKQERESERDEESKKILTRQLSKKNLPRKENKVIFGLLL